jgi:ABC-type sugar transport system ATPase subunit
MSQTLLRVENIRKSFGGVRALKGVSFGVGSAEIVALIGENGAGKSTLMKILGGVLTKSRFRLKA